MKTFRKVFFYFFLAIATLLLSGIIAVFVFKERIIQQFVSEANKQLSTPIKIGKIDVSWFEDFPNLSIVFTDVYVEDSYPGIYPLITAKSLSFQLNAGELWRGNYSIRGLHIRDSETNLKIDAKGVNNYTVVKENAGTGGGSISFSLENVNLEGTKFHYIDLKLNQEFTISSKNLKASINTKEDVYAVQTNGDITTQKIKVQHTEVFAGKTFDLESDLVYDDVKKNLLIKPSELQLRSSIFNVSGNYNWKEQSLIDLQVDGKDTDIQTLLSLMPENVAGDLAKYKSKGEMYFNAHLKGEISDAKSPSLTAKFGFKKATLYHPDYKSEIESASLEGSFASSDVMDASKAVLVLKNIEGELNRKSFHANLVIQNFKDSDVQADFKGELDAASLFNFYPLANIKNVSGSIVADISFKGRMSSLKNRTTAKQTSTRGKIDLHKLEFKYGKEEIFLRQLNGSLQFNNNDLALSNVSAKLGNSDFLLNGFFKNIITYLLFDDQPIGIETDLKSKFLDLDELFALGFGKEDDAKISTKTTEYEFKLSKNINLNFNCDVKALRYKRFHAQSVRGDLLVKNQMAVSRKITMQSMGGTLSASCILDAKNPKAIDVVSAFKLTGIYADSIFYVFENFDQDFIQDKHLKGQAYADVTMEMVLGPDLKLFSETLIADISAVIKNGELNNFAPLKKLDKYLDDEGLGHVRFSDLKNDIHIENKTIFIPQMEVRTNVTNLRISGTHTLDQRIDYHIVAPLRSYKKINLGEAGNAVENDAGQSKIFLKIVGTTDNYRIAYDTEAVKKKIINDLKQEVKDLKDAFKNKGVKQQKELELEKDDYFDWDE